MSQISNQLIRSIIFNKNQQNLVIKNWKSLKTSSIKFGPIQDRLETLLKNKLDPLNLQVLNESSMHNVPKDSETHFRIIIVSNQFNGLNSLNRHRKVVEILKDEFQKIHALAIEAYTPIQWENDLNGKLDCRKTKSPKCLGGSKK